LIEMSGTIGERACLQYACHDTTATGEAAEFHAMPGKRLVQFEKAPYAPEIQGRIAQQLKAQYDVAEPIPDRLAELLEQLAQLELLKELTQLTDEPDSKGG
jgi:Anti-sigma factor NepR